MLIYNVTINIDDSVHEEWMQWMMKKHIPDMLATKKFVGAKMCKVIIEEETGGTTYSVQYKIKSRKILEKYYQEDAEKMQREGNHLFPNKFVAFRTELEIINEQSL
ncbi:MAG: DUF4286 family protein [Bacteroidota bacterium]